MPTLQFAKVHGLGNDFVLVDRRGAADRPTARLAARLCERRLGVGADGLIVALPPRRREAFARMLLLNADGSTAEMCGNGLRALAHHLGVTAALVDTDAGLFRVERLADDRIRTALGKATTLGRREVEAVGRRFTGTVVSTGNPHFVLEHDAGDGPLLRLAERYGPALERDPLFPSRTNVEFARIVDRSNVELVVFERGAGLTLACGTGAAATVRALREKLDPGAVTVHLPGGPLEITLAGDEVTQVGPAVTVFRGAIEVSADELEPG